VSKRGASEPRSVLSLKHCVRGRVVMVQDALVTSTILTSYAEPTVSDVPKLGHETSGAANSR
jgi:hypothetical protein